MLTETAARWLLVLHTALGVAAVGAATHLVLWMRDYRRGKLGRHRAIRRFAWLAFALHGAGFLVGNLMYPTYRVEVRAAYFDNPMAVTADREARARAIAGVAHEPAAPVEAGDEVRRAAAATKWFDIKEHWIALGLLVSAALVLTLSWWDPKRDGLALVPIVRGMAFVVAMSLWIAAIIGVVVASVRAI